MKESIFNQNIYVEYPDEFAEMSEAEIKKYFASDILRFGIRSAEKHVILSVAKTNNSVLSLLTDAKAY